MNQAIAKLSPRLYKPAIKLKRNPNRRRRLRYGCARIRKILRQRIKYIKRDRWLELWQESTRMPSITQVDIRPVKNKGDTHETLAAVAAEVAKYAVKASKRDKNHPYIRKTDEETDAAVEELISFVKS